MKQSATWAIKATPSSLADYKELTANDSVLLYQFKGLDFYTVALHLL